jgi:PAS domain-containing protein
VDRVGVWLEAGAYATRLSEIPGTFQGAVWDRENGEMPSEWANLSVEPPLPGELLYEGKSVEQDLESVPERPIIGPLVELRRALWIPIGEKGELKGVILAGSRGKQVAMPMEHAQAVAAELALAIAFEEEQKITRLRTADFAVVLQILEALSSNVPAEASLSNLVRSCTETLAGQQGPVAVFAVIGVLTEQPGKTGEKEEMKFHWGSGDPEWTGAVACEPLASVWRMALEARRLVGSMPHISWARGSVARIVAFPLESDGQVLGTLVAGLPRSAISLASIERLELPAALAAAALGRRKRNEEESQQAEWQQALLDSGSEAMFLLDETGGIAASSRRARELTGQASLQDKVRPPSNPSRERFASQFRGQDRDRIETWLQRALSGRSTGRVSIEDSPQAELYNGVTVSIRAGSEERRSNSARTSGRPRIGA